MFVKARLDAFADRENLFALPQPNDWVAEEELGLIIELGKQHIWLQHIEYIIIREHYLKFN